MAANELEKSRKELAGEYERVQKKAFTNWVNSHLLKAGQKVDNLYEDFRDGQKLLLLLELLTESKLPREKGKMRFHKLQNVGTALEFLQKERKIKLVNIRNDEIVDGNPKLILGLVWTLILHFQISGGLSLEERPTSPRMISTKDLKEQLLGWAQKATEGYDDVVLKNFDTSWRNGMGFCAIINRHRPDILDFDDCDVDKPMENLQRAFDAAEKELGVIKIVDPEDVCVPKPDDKAVLTYVSFLHHAFPEMPPPHWKKKPTVSLEDYKSLYESTQKWIDEKTEQAKSRDFPSTVDEMKACIADFDKTVTKKIPVKKRDMSTLSDLSEKLKGQKKTTIPTDLEYPKLKESWTGLQTDAEDCKNAMENELKRLEDLQCLADKILSECDTAETGLDELEEKIKHFEGNSTSMAPGDVAKLSSDIKEQIKALEKALNGQAPGVQQLKDGNYHDVDTVDQRLGSLLSRLASLAPRLDEASSAVNEAQVVAAIESNLDDLEVWLVTSGKFSNNQQILMQIEDHKAFQYGQLAAAEESIAQINDTPPPPGYEEKVKELNKRWEQVVKHTKDRLAGLEPIIQTVRSYDSVSNPLEDWASQTRESYEQLPPLEVTEEQLVQQKEEILAIKEDVGAQDDAVEKVQEYSEQFLRDTEPVQSLADRYARKLKSRERVAKSEASRDSQELEEASLSEQAEALQIQWEWLRSHADARSRQIDYLLDKIRQFNDQYSALRQFVDEGNKLLEEERPVGDTAARIQEQMDTCQDFRAKISAKQPTVDSMLALGRAVLAEPNTTTQNDALMQKLTGFISDWSDLQLTWQNWYNQLHANMEQSHNLSDQLVRFKTDIEGLEPLCSNLFPATVSIEGLKQELHHLQTKFKAEVLSPYEGRQAVYQDLRSKLQLLPDKQSAEESFKKFEEVASIIEGRRDELSAVVVDVDGWWDAQETSSEWLTETEKTLAGEKPLASSVVIVEEQERKIKREAEDVTAHKAEVEKVLKSLGELASHETLLKPSPIVSYKEQMKTRWDTLCNEVQERSELCTEGKDQLSSYAADSTPFNSWLKMAEERQVDLGSLPRSKEDMKRKQEEMKEFADDVDSHSVALDQVETKGSNFLSSAKAYQSQLISYRQAIEPEEGEKPPEFFIDLRTEEEDITQLSFTPTFDGDEYENGIKVVTGYSGSLRKRYDALNASVQQYKQLVDEAVNRRDEFDSSLDGFLEALADVEKTCNETESQPMRVQERVEIVRSLEVDCLALEPQLQTVVSNYDLLADLGENDDRGSLWEGEDEALKGKVEAERRHQELLSRLKEQRESLNAELSDAQAFLGSFEDFLSWLRETERKIQRDDPLKLEEEDLKTGLAYLKGVASDITAHKGAYETLCSKCQDLIDRGVQDSDELRQNLDNVQQRWNSVQIVNDDIEVIEETIPKLESFNSSYSQLSSDNDDMFNRITSFSVSAISSQGLEVKGQALQEFSGEVDKTRAEFETLLSSCDLFDTPFDATKFEADVSALQDRINLCEKAIGSKRSDLKTLEKKVRPMEDLFQKFRTWLSEIGTQLSSLSPPSQQEGERSRQLQQAKVIVENVQAHREDLEGVEDAVNILSPLVDESDQVELKSQLEGVTGQYDSLRFDSELYPVERWVEDRTKKLAVMCPTGVTVPSLQDQLTEIQDFLKCVESFKPQLDSLSSLATQADQARQQDSPAGSKMADIQQRYDKLKVLAAERLSMLSSYLPDIQRYESSRSAWESLLCGWENKASTLPSHGATPQSIQAQMDEIKALQQAITDHEPEFVSLKREANTLCQGSPSEPDYFDHLSKEVPGPPGRNSARPGKENQEETITDYERRLEALKQELVTDSTDLASKLVKSNQFMDDIAGLLAWVDEAAGSLDELVIRDPKSAPIETQHKKCQEMLEQMSSHQAMKDDLQPLFVQLTTELPDDSDERTRLQKQLDEIDQKWTNLSDQLKQHQSNLDTALPLAKSHESTMGKLLPWVPNALERLETMGPPPAEPDVVEQLKSEVENMKAQYNSLAPVYSTCVEDGQSLSTKCEEGQPRTELDEGVSDLQDKWEKLNQLFGDILQKLTDTLVQTQEFQAIANGLDRWMDGMGNTLRQQERIAARVRLIEPQIEGFRHILSDITAYSATVDQAKTVGASLIDESKPEESLKVKGHLEALTTQFSKLETAAQTRMTRLEGALQCATVYEDEGSNFSKWLVEAEEKLSSMDAYAIASQPLKQQLDDVKSLTQDVESHKTDVDKLTKSEEDLFDTELPTIQLCEEHLSDTAAADKLVLPDWLERPGAPEAVGVGADLRDRFSKLKLSVGTRCDEGTQLLQSVLAYESDFEKFNEWLCKEKMAVSSFSPPAITVDGLRSQLEEVENSQRDFKNQEDPLESLNAQGTSLIEFCKAELSQISATNKLSDLNESWGDVLSSLSSREEKLKEGLVLAEAYQGLHDNLNGWLTSCETKLEEPLRTDGDPRAMKKQLEELKVLSEEIDQHKQELEGVVSAGHKLESSTDAEASSLPDIGYTALEERYNALKVKLGDQISQLEGALGQASDLNSHLQELLKQLTKMRTQLADHKPPRVQPAHIEKQLKELSVTDSAFAKLQPKVDAAKQEGAAFASPDTRGTPPPEGIPSGAEIQQLLSDINHTNGKVDGLLSHWKDLLASSLETAKKFAEDHKSLSNWINEKEAELAGADTVRGVPEGVEEQLDQVEALQQDLTKHRTDLDSVATVARALTAHCSPDDATAVEERLSQLNAAFEALQRSVNSRKRELDDGLSRALTFLAAWNDALDAIAEKSSELDHLGPVGVDIETVKSQLEEYKEFEASLSELKPKVTAALVQGKQLKDSCSAQDEPFISEQLDKLNAAWSQLNSDSLGRKHKLEDALLQLGQFHEALAELLSWIVNCSRKISDAPPPGVKAESVEGQMRDLKAIEAGVSSHAPSVASLNTVGEKLVSSTAADNTAEIQQELLDLNNQWDELKTLTAARSQILEDALSKVKAFNDKWKKELSWLTDAESRAYTDWKPCGLPDTCQADIDNHLTFTSEVDSHKQPIEALKAEGDALKVQGSPEEQRIVDRWVEDTRKRYEDLKFTLDEREAQINYAKERADEFDQSYSTLRDKVAKQEEAQEKQGPIRSEVEAVKQQMEDHKEFMKELSELEGQLDELDGWGQLLVKDCVQPDGEIIQDRVEELRARLEDLNSLAADRQAALEESLLSLGEFEEAYDELWTWLADALRQLEEAEPITGDPDAVAAQLARHKALQKQLGARLSSKNAVSRAGKLLMKHKTGEDKAVLKKKLQDLEGEWEKACQVSVDRQDKLENAYKEIGQFRSYVGPLRSWTAKVLPSLDESEPVHGDLDTVDSLLAAHEAVQRDLEAYQNNADAANAGGDRLIAEVLDDPTVTQQDLQELNESWNNVCQRSVAKQERLEDAYRAAESFEDGYGEIVQWIDAQSAELQSVPPPDEDSAVLQQQIEEHKELSQEVTVRQTEFDRVLAEGQNLLQVAHPRAVPILQSKLQQMERKWVDLRGRIGARSEALASALLELHGLQDMLDNLWSWVAGAETTIRETELVPIANDLETVEHQLAEHETFQEEMATQQPNMDALNKAAKKRKANYPHANPEMTKKIGSLYKRWQKLWLRSSERHRQLLEARTRLKDIALARSFDFDKWRKRFNNWVDQQKLRVSDLFNRFDSNHDGMLTREEFMKALKASGLAITQIELEKIADTFDKDRSGMIDLSSIVRVLKGGTRRARPLVQEALTDSDKIEHEIQHQVSKCSCTHKFLVTRVAEGKYRFGDNQKLHLVRILRSTVMVRVGGGWEPLEEFLQKHDPCRAAGRTNKALRGLLTKRRTPGLATAGFTTKQGTQIAAKNEAVKRAAVNDPSSKLATRTFAHGRKDATVTTRTPVSTTRTKNSRESTPLREQQRRRSPHGSAPSSGRSTPLGEVKRTAGARLQSPQPRSSTPSTKNSRGGTPTSLHASPRHLPSSSRLGTKNGSVSPKADSVSPQDSTPTTPTKTSSNSGIPRVSRIPTPRSTAKKPTKKT